MWQIRCSSPAICHRVRCQETFCIWFLSLFFFFSYSLWVVDAHIHKVCPTYTASDCDVWQGIFFEYLHWDTVILLEFQLHFLPDIVAAVYVYWIDDGWLRGVLGAGMSELRCIFHAAAERRVGCWVLKLVLWRPCNYLPIIAHMLGYNWASPPVVSEGWISDSEWQPVIILYCLYVLRNLKVTQQKHSFCLCRVW